MLCLVSEVVRLVNNSVVIVTFAYKDEHLIKYLLICTLKPALYVYLFFHMVYKAWYLLSCVYLQINYQ